MRILIVEDEENLRETMVEVLQGITTTIFEAKNGYEGMQLLKEKTFDLVISDYHMPKMSGLDLLQVCRAENIRVPTILISGRGNPELQVYAWQYGLFDYLEKPYRSEDLMKSIQLVASMSPEMKSEFFSDFTSPLFDIPYSTVSNRLKKTTLRSFFEWCEVEKISPSIMLKKLAE
jgi:DNA-binding response OmpR family regulator